MRNRAKCKLCGDILESFHRYDYVTCRCGEISIDGGGDYYHCSAKNFDNFLRVDDEGNEIVVKIQDADNSTTKEESQPELKRKDLIDMLEAMYKNIENLPSAAQHSPINHYDLYCALALIHQIFKREN